MSSSILNRICSKDTWKSALAANCNRMTMNGTIVAGGFVLGAICGAVMLLGPEDTAVHSSDAEATSEITAPPESDVPSEGSGSLRMAVERDKLKEELNRARLEWEIAELKRQLSAVRDRSAGQVDSSPADTSEVSTWREDSTDAATPAADSSAPVSGAATLRYWNQMNDLILQEARMRTPPLGGITTATAAGSFLDARLQAATYASRSLADLDQSGVDPEVLALSQRLGEWYEEGCAVAQAGRSLLSGGSVQARQGAAGRQYQEAEQNHARNVDAVNAYGERVRQSISRKYGITVPPLN